MLRITIPSTEFWDEVKQEFVYTKAQTLQLEHSLVSLSKWESRWNKPFLTKQEKNFGRNHRLCKMYDSYTEREPGSL